MGLCGDLQTVIDDNGFDLNKYDIVQLIQWVFQWPLPPTHTMNDSDQTGLKLTHGLSPAACWSPGPDSSHPLDPGWLPPFWSLLWTLELFSTLLTHCQWLTVPFSVSVICFLSPRCLVSQLPLRMAAPVASNCLQRKAWRDQETESTSCLNLRWESRYEFLLHDKYSRFLSLPSLMLLLGGYLYCWGLTQWHRPSVVWSPLLSLSVVFVFFVCWLWLVRVCTWHDSLHWHRLHSALSSSLSPREQCVVIISLTIHRYERHAAGANRAERDINL